MIPSRSHNQQPAPGGDLASGESPDPLEPAATSLPRSFSPIPPGESPDPLEPAATPSLSPEAPEGLSRSRIISGLIFSVVISMAGLVAVFLILGDTFSWRKMAVFFGSEGLAAVALLLVSWLADSFRWWLFAITLGGRLRWRDLLCIVLAGYFISGVTPFTSGGGPVKIYALSQHALTVGQATAVVAAAGLVNQMVLAAGALLVTVASDYTHQALGRWTDAAVYLYLGGLVLFLAVLLNTDRFLRGTAGLGRRLGLSRWWGDEKGSRIRQKLLRASADFQEGLRLLLSHPGRLFLACFSTVLFYLLFFSIVPVLLLALGVHVPFWRALALQNVFWLLCTLMPTPGASGGAELGFVAVFIGLVPASLLPTLAMAWRLLTFYLRLLCGWPCFVAVLRRRRR